MSYVGNKPAQTTIPADDSVTSAMIVDGAVANVDINASAGIALSKLASDPTYDDSGVQDDIAILGFKVAANGSLAKYDLVDQAIDAFEDASGVDAGASTNESRNSANYYVGGSTSIAAQVAFTSTGANTWTCPAGLSSLTDVLTVAGGAGGGRYSMQGGGGGAGGLVYDATYAVTAGVVYDITVGAGGAGGGFTTDGSNGANSVWNVNAEGSGLTQTAVGGGGGAGHQEGEAGGSGGGGQPSRGGGAATQGDSGGGTGFGNAGAAGYGGGGTNDQGGGAGGAGAAGTAGGSNKAGNGGVGKDYSSIFGASVGESGFFAGGGGGGTRQQLSARGIGGNGGGGDGQFNGDAGANGAANTGGGGGGGSAYDSGGTGGSGVVLIKHDAYTAPGADLTLVSNSTTAEAVPTKGDIVLTYTNGAGSATINTDLKAWVSRDNGSNYTQATLASQGTTGGHSILTAHDLDISSQPSGSNMRYKITTHNQSAAKETRIQAVSLGWS